jgi:acetyl esterase
VRRALAMVALATMSVTVTSTAAPAAPAGPVRLPNTKDPVVVLLEQVYGLSPGPKHTFNAYLPQLGGGPYPGVILIHGGGWRHGSKHDMAFIGRYFARRGLAAFSINYRLVPRHPWPAQIEDARMAVEWIRSQATTYNIDPSRLGAFGVSAGGHLAALLSTQTDGQPNSGAGVKAAAAWSAPMDLLGMTSGETNPAKVKRFLDCDSESECEAAAAAASPITFVDRSDPWLYFVHSRYETRVPVSSARRMDRRMRDVRAPHTYIELPGDKHSKAYKNDRVPGSSKTVIQATLDFFLTHL